MRCDELEPLIEAIADGTFEPAPEDRAHLSSCAVCAARLAQAQSIEQWLTSRETPQPPASFTASVMARIGQEKWQTERVVDIGFNLAIAAGVLVILAGGAGLAWSLGFFTIDIDVIALAQRRDLASRGPRDQSAANGGDRGGGADDGAGVVVVGRSGDGLRD